MSNFLVSVRLLTAAALLGACGPSSKPTLEPLDPEVEGVVGVELIIHLRASDPDGDTLSFGYDVPALPELKRRQMKPELRSFQDGTATFRWTPLSSDVGEWDFDFTVSDGSNTTKETILVTVKSAVGTSTAPVFRTPSGSGTTLDLGQTRCLELPVVVEDPDSQQVEITLGRGYPDGMTISQEDPVRAVLAWCPSDEQIAERDRYTVVLEADDRDNPATTKPYLIVIRKPPRMGCEGLAPVVSHTEPGPQTTRAPVAITVDVSDDMGLKSPPLLYWSTTPPASPIDFGALTQIEMTQESGDARAGRYVAQVPNPVAGAQGGTRQTLYYLVVAQDNDDETGDCDHLTQAPEQGSYSVEVTAGGSATVGFCMACTDDVQCGDTNLCVRVGTAGNSYCLADCQDGQACPAGTACSDMPVAGTLGMRRQCAPQNGSCEPDLPPMCMDDGLEDNDRRLDIPNPMSFDLPGGTYDLQICPAGPAANDDDYYRLNVLTETQVTARIDFNEATDLDLRLLDGTGTVLRKSEGIGPIEQVIECVRTPGVYFLQVAGYRAPTSASYRMTMERRAGPCCADDANEPDDNQFQATDTSGDLLAGAYMAGNRKICSGNDDWYKVPVFSGQTLVIELTFMQATSDGDLDVHVYDPMGATDLTPCSPMDVTTCQTMNGQGSMSNERMTWMAPGDGTYYVVIRGFGNATNDYSIRITRM